RSAFAQGVGAPLPRLLEQSVWTGSHFLAYSGEILGTQSSEVTREGGLYDPVLDMWLSGIALQSTNDAPLGGRGPSAVAWTGSEFIVWGGGASEWPQGGGLPVTTYYNTGGVYVPPRVTPTIRSGQVEHALQANTFFRHRVTVYGCPRASVGVMGMPSWMTQKW